MMPKGEDEAPFTERSHSNTSDRNGGGEEAFGASEDADELGEAAVPRSNGERGNHLLQDDDLVALEDDLGERREKENIGNEGENSTATAVAATQQEQQVRITIYWGRGRGTCSGFLRGQRRAILCADANNIFCHRLQ